MIALQILTIVILLAILAVVAVKSPFMAAAVEEPAVEKEEAVAPAEASESQKKQDELIDRGFENIMTYSVDGVGIRRNNG